MAIGHWSAYAVALHRKRPSNVSKISDDVVVLTMFRFQRSARTRRRVVASRSRIPSQERPPKKPQRDKWNFRKTVKVRSMHIACMRAATRAPSQISSCYKQTSNTELQNIENIALYMTPHNLHTYRYVTAQNFKTERSDLEPFIPSKGKKLKCANVKSDN